MGLGSQNRGPSVKASFDVGPINKGSTANLITMDQTGGCHDAQARKCRNTSIVGSVVT